MAARHRSLAAGALFLSASLLLSGCGLMSQLTTEFSSTPSAAPSTPTPTPTPTNPTPKLAVGTVVATGHLVGDPSIAGNVDVRVGRAGAFELRLLGFTSDRDEEVELRVSPNVVEPGTKCTSSIMNLSYGNLPAGTEQSFPLMMDFTGGDPSFLDTVLIAHHDFDAFTEGCYVSVLSSAILEWTLPDMRPELVVADSGKTGGASGEVTIVDGEAVSYTVAPNDVADEVAARFGISRDDLFYLNPIRTTIIEYPMLQIGEVLNISKAQR